MLRYVTEGCSTAGQPQQLRTQLKRDGAALDTDVRGCGGCACSPTPSTSFLISGLGERHSYVVRED
jgi:hypothetical protein